LQRPSPIVHAYHSIFSAYGFWLPNDPRGSYSDFVASWDLFLAGGKATKVSTTRSVAARPHDQQLRLKTKEALNFPPVQLTPAQIQTVADGFAVAVRKSGYVLHACAILPKHVHAVIARHKFDVERIVGHLKTEATMALVRAAHHPFQNLQRPGGRLVSCWGERGWNVYLESDADIRRAIDYVRQNLVRAGLPPQEWAFLTPYAAASTRPD
jgi:REP element-mobilizing transposase RayT